MNLASVQYFIPATQLVIFLSEIDFTFSFFCMLPSAFSQPQHAVIVHLSLQIVQRVWLLSMHYN